MSRHEMQVTVADNCLLCGLVETEDASFDHEFGVEKQVSINIVEFSVIVYIGGNDYDITSALSEGEIEYFKDRFLEKVTGSEWRVG